MISGPCGQDFSREVRSNEETDQINDVRSANPWGEGGDKLWRDCILRVLKKVVICQILNLQKFI